MPAPTRIGRYEIVRRIGCSMTEVYLAIDTVENRKAALKLVKQDNGAESRLVTEAERRGAAILQSLEGVDPRVVRIYDFGDADGYFFVAMQYVEGHSLAEVLEHEHTLDYTRAAVIALEMCEQLAKFHCWQSAVVHGDIKPANIHLGPNDTVRLLDFGIAKTLRAAGDATVLQFGSPGYCAPERLTRSAVDEQSDLWGVAATLYEMLAGVPPYRAQDTHKLESLIRSKRPPRALPPHCPRALGMVVAKALAPEPERRYRSAAELQSDLQAFLEHRPTLAEKERRARRTATRSIEAARDYLRKATRTVVRARKALHMAGAVGWFLAGMALWIGGTLAFQAWHGRAPVHAQPPRPQIVAKEPVPKPAMEVPNPVALTSPEPDLRAQYASDAEQVLTAYRTSADPTLGNFDWEKAEICLEHAVDLGASDDRTLGELALSRGYATLASIESNHFSPAAAAKMRVMAYQEFSLAAQKLPRDPDPHLALARFYVYASPNYAKAMAEFAAAERLGAKPGRRENKLKTDAWRLRSVRLHGKRTRRYAWR
jgi:hypothetical protein